jgi:hypothetical protein
MKKKLLKDSTIQNLVECGHITETVDILKKENFSQEEARSYIFSILKDIKK